MLDVDDVSVFYGDAQALDGVSAGGRHAGTIVAIVGAKGAMRKTSPRDPHHQPNTRHRPASGRDHRVRGKTISRACRATASATSASARSRRDGRYFLR